MAKKFQLPAHKVERNSHSGDELRSFDRWRYSDHGDPTGLRDYLSAVTDHLGDYAHLTVPVVNAAGLSAADWYRRMLTGTA
jgi:hypothetical protein